MMELNEAHKTALLLLKIVDDYCINNKIVYTLSDSSLIALEKLDFSLCYPRINIAVEYEGYKRIIQYLNDFCKKNNGYSLHNYKNTNQFYTPDSWFVKHSKVKLEEDRKEEEFYYGTTLVITPLYYAGTSKKEWKKTYRYYRKNILPTDFRAMLKKKPIFTWLYQLPRRISTRYFLKHRDFGNFEKNIRVLENAKKADYILFPAKNLKLSGINQMPDILSKKSNRLTYTSFWSRVQRINYYGVECYCVKDRERLTCLYGKETIKEILKPKKSQLLLGGGEELRRIQLVQIDLLIEFDRICRKYGLKYNINFGTLIGAMRHKGFIPWDDDIDVTMYYKDCDKLFEIMEKELDKNKYFYRCPQTEPYHHIIFNHLERKGTVFTKAGREKLKNTIGVFIDIFPMYPAAPNVFLDFFHTRICRFWRTALWATVGAESEKKLLKRSYYKMLAQMGGEKCRRNFIKCATFFENKKGRLKFWTSVDRSPYNVDLVRKDNYDNAIEVEFEKHMFYAPAHYEGTLEFCFSKDWRLYPMVKDRVPTHDAMIDIGNLYQYSDDEDEEL